VDEGGKIQMSEVPIDVILELFDIPEEKRYELIETLKKSGIKIVRQTGKPDVALFPSEDDMKRVAPSLQRLSKRREFPYPFKEKKVASLREILNWLEESGAPMIPTDFVSPLTDKEGVKAYLIPTEKELNIILTDEESGAYYWARGFPSEPADIDFIIEKAYSMWLSDIQQKKGLGNVESNRIYRIRCTIGQEEFVANLLNKFAKDLKAPVEAVGFMPDAGIVLVMAPLPKDVDEFLEKAMQQPEAVKGIQRATKYESAQKRYYFGRRERGSFSLEEMLQMREVKYGKPEIKVGDTAYIVEGPLKGSVVRVVGKKKESYEVEPLIHPIPKEFVMNFAPQELSKGGKRGKSITDFKTGDKVIIRHPTLDGVEGEVLGAFEGTLVVKFQSPKDFEFVKAEKTFRLKLPASSLEVPMEKEFGVVWLKRFPREIKYT
jgi:transcription antitermination factor NusG